METVPRQPTLQPFKGFPPQDYLLLFLRIEVELELDQLAKRMREEPPEQVGWQDLPLFQHKDVATM